MQGSGAARRPSVSSRREERIGPELPGFGNKGRIEPAAGDYREPAAR